MPLRSMCSILQCRSRFRKDYERQGFVAKRDVASLIILTTAAFIARDVVLMKSSTRDQIKGAFKEGKGKVKEKAGKATGDPDLCDRGTAEKAGGKVRRIAPQSPRCKMQPSFENRAVSSVVEHLVYTARYTIFSNCPNLL
jgi:uncharacterized protein YjbJ (UPF0337 family)